jgi:hypothetical protein
MSSKAVVGLIRAEVGDTSIGSALATCSASGLAQAIVVDAHRGEKDYAEEPVIKERRLQVFYESSLDEAQRRLAEPACAGANYVLEVPPTFRCTAPSLAQGAVRALPAWAQQMGLAPSYYTPSTSIVWPCLALLTHLAWSFFSLLNRGRAYRGSYAVLRAVARQRGAATIAMEGGAAPWKRQETAMVLPLPDTTPMNEFLYWMTRESFGLRRWILLLIYVRLLTFPYFGLMLGNATLSELFPVPLLLAWLFHGLAALVYAQHYFPNMALPAVHAFALPLLMLPWLLLCLYAKTVWRGYQGEAPRMQWPEMPRATLSPPSQANEGATAERE